jgi:hypothetical protein
MGWLGRGMKLNAAASRAQVISVIGSISSVAMTAKAWPETYEACGQACESDDLSHSTIPMISVSPRSKD